MKHYTENFTIVKNSYITDDTLDCFEFRVYCYLLMLSDNEGECFPSYKTIAKKTGMGESKAKNTIKKLLKLGLIEKQKRKKTDGSFGSNLYVVCEKTDGENEEVLKDTTGSVRKILGDSLCNEQGCASDNEDKYININNNIFTNNHLSSIDELMEKAQTYNLFGETKKNFEAALEIMYNSKSICVGGVNIPRNIVQKRLMGICYWHIVYVDVNMPRTLVNKRPELNVRNPVPYIVTSLYNALRFSEEEVEKMV